MILGEFKTGQGCVIWLTGLSGAGKSTIARELERELLALRKCAYVLDGDVLRQGLSSDLTYSPQHRVENIRRVGEVAKLFSEVGIICIVALISPYQADRDLVRGKLAPGHFVEVYVNTPLQICEQRDPKGLYAKARAGTIQQFTGVSAPYESPVKPELELTTDNVKTATSVAEILKYLQARFPF